MAAPATSLLLGQDLVPVIPQMSWHAQLRLCCWWRLLRDWKSSRTTSSFFHARKLFFHASKLLSSKFRHSSSHSARNSCPSRQVTMSCSTRGMSPDIVLFPCGCHAGSHCHSARQNTLPHLCSYLDPLIDARKV